jgi:NADPH-dependent curcumin reductase CurA
MQTVVTLDRRPDGLPVPGVDLVVRRVPVPRELQAGECLVKNLYLSLDPAGRGWMSPSRNSYLPPVELGAVMRGGSVGVVVESRSHKIAKGTFVNVQLSVGWAQWGVARDDTLLPIKTRVGIPLRAWAGVLGGTGLTAYFGLLEVAKPRRGELVVVSAAAGAVGCVAAQIAKRVCGCRVVGIAGGRDKCQWLVDTLGLDAAVDYKSATFEQDLRRSAGKVDVFFDNVGGAVLDAVLKRLNENARVVLCGQVSGMVRKAAPIENLIVKSARMEGFVLMKFKDRYEEAFDRIADMLLRGDLMYNEDVVEGLENAPQAFLKLFGEHGGNRGKLVVDLHVQAPPHSVQANKL